MKTFSIILLAAAFAAAPAKAMAQKPAARPAAAFSADSTVNALKIKTLTERKERLKKAIEAEDKKRGQKREGVAPERNERLNDRQDSICLDLRSQLCDVNLQLRELAPASTAAIAHQYSLMRRPNATPGKPAKPAAPGRTAKRKAGK